jgi:predicted ferric reductase
MRRIRIVFAVFVLVLGGIWLMADTLRPEPFTYFTFRDVFLQFSGLLAIGCMSAAVLLAARPRSLEPHMDGLDKMYRLHKWLGIGTLAVALSHWWFVQGTRWMLALGWIARRTREPQPVHAVPGAIEQWLSAQHGLADSVGEWTFYAVAVLLVLALLRRFPYHLFARTHVLLAPAYLLLTYHAVVWARYEYWSQPVGWLLALMLVTGTVAALMSLLGRIGAGSKTRGSVEFLQDYPDLKVLEMRIALQTGWPGHKAGQFAFVCAAPHDEAHPYSIASAWDPRDPRITFIAKELGDHTSTLRASLTIGTPVTVEGPYGCFDFEDGLARQVWIGAGIGITPFIARMKQLAAQGHHASVDLFHPTSSGEPGAIAKLRAAAQAAGVRLHVVVTPRRLDGPRLRAMLPHWIDASIWFCGPSAYGAHLRSDLIGHGLPAARFHQELFNMR